MATTTNFGWETPDDTDLVKDGALAMRTLGNAIDASLVDLKGGTTGQVLSKTSNTDMDFTWVTSDDANAIQNAIVDAKGDLITATAADTPARLAVGSNGDTLVADSAATTGLRWSGGLGLAQPVINGGMDVWQRGTSIALSTGTYTADRWYGYRAVSGSTVSRQSTNDTTNLPFIQYCARVQRDSGNTATNGIWLTTNFETANSIPYAGKTVTLSFYARAGANYSSASSQLQVRIYTGTGTDQNLVNGYTGAAVPLSSDITLTTTWQRFSLSATLASSTTEIGLRFYNDPVGTAGANDWYEVTGVQIDVGNVALPFRRSGGTIQGELAACQRYYFRMGGDPSANYPVFGTGSASGTGNVLIYVKHPVTMRVEPTAIDQANLAVYDGGTVTGSPTSVTLDGDIQSKDYSNVNFAKAASFTQFRPYALLGNANTAAYLGLSAEL